MNTKRISQQEIDQLFAELNEQPNYQNIRLEVITEDNHNRYAIFADVPYLYGEMRTCLIASFSYSGEGGAIAHLVMENLKRSVK